MLKNYIAKLRFLLSVLTAKQKTSNYVMLLVTQHFPTRTWYIIVRHCLIQARDYPAMRMRILRKNKAISSAIDYNMLEIEVAG